MKKTTTITLTTYERIELNLTLRLRINALRNLVRDDDSKQYLVRHINILKDIFTKLKEQ